MVGRAVGALQVTYTLSVAISTPERDAVSEVSARMFNCTYPCQPICPQVLLNDKGQLLLNQMARPRPEGLSRMQETF